MTHPIRNTLLGLVVGDALGVPVEFQYRTTLKANPVTDMTGYGTHNQPPGTWSDDSSLALCLADELSKGFNLQNIADSFINWLYHNHWTPYGEVFDVGNSTEKGIHRLKDGIPPEQSGETDETSNGNGSLMRILPLLFHAKNIAEDLKRYEIIRQVSAITHAHIRSTLSCFYYLEFARFILDGHSPKSAYQKANESFLGLTEQLQIDKEELSNFDRLTKGTIDALEEENIFSDTYVIYTLEASIWCILTTDNYKDAVLKAVNLGKDTDTTAAVTGGIAGLIYTAGNIPKEWVNKIAKLEDIEEVADRLNNDYS